MDVHRFISEVHSRPALWDMRNADAKSRYCSMNLWKEVSSVVGVEVELCRRKWKNLRDAYRAEVRRSERRIERDRAVGEYEPNKNYGSKWAYFDSLHFINDYKRPRLSTSYDFENTSSNDDPYDSQFQRVYDIKLEPDHHHDDEEEESTHHVDVDDDREEEDDDDVDDEAANDILFEEFQAIATPQAARRLSALSMTNSYEQNLSNDNAADKPSTSDNSNDNKDCKCTTRTEDRVHFLEDLEKEEQKLMQSTTMDIKRAMDHVGDSDYNFLVSFLPQMKKMSELQNLQFRARMCDMVLGIMAPTINTQNSPVPPPLTPAPAMAQIECRMDKQLASSQCSGSCGGSKDPRRCDNISINAATSTSCNLPL